METSVRISDGDHQSPAIMVVQSTNRWSRQVYVGAFYEHDCDHEVYFAFSRRRALKVAWTVFVAVLHTFRRNK